jgi:hypothetical protein
MIKKISKIMWGLVIGLILFSFIVGGVTNNMTLPYMVGYIIPWVFIIQIVLFAIGYLIKNKNA